MADQPPLPGPASDNPRRCENCRRPLVSIELIAEAIHSGCALTGERHDLRACPSYRVFIMDAKGIQGYIERHAG